MKLAIAKGQPASQQQAAGGGGLFFLVSVPRRRQQFDDGRLNRLASMATLFVECGLP